MHILHCNRNSLENILLSDMTFATHLMNSAVLEFSASDGASTSSATQDQTVDTDHNEVEGMLTFC